MSKGADISQAAETPLPVLLTQGERQFVRAPRMVDELIATGKLADGEMAAYTILGKHRCLFASEVMAAWGVKELTGFREKVRFSEPYLKWCAKENEAGADWRLCFDLGLSIEEMLALRGFDAHLVPSFYIGGGYAKERWLATRGVARYRLVNFKLRSLEEVSLLGVQMVLRARLLEMVKEAGAEAGPKRVATGMPLSPTYFDVSTPIAAANLAFSFAMFYPPPFPLDLGYHTGSIDSHPVGVGLFDLEGLHFLSLENVNLLKGGSRKADGRAIKWGDIGFMTELHGTVLESFGSRKDLTPAVNTMPTVSAPEQLAVGRVAGGENIDPYDLAKAKESMAVEEPSRHPPRPKPAKAAGSQPSSGAKSSAAGGDASSAADGRMSRRVLIASIVVIALSLGALMGSSVGKRLVPVSLWNTAPTVAEPARAESATITGKTAVLNVLGADDGGEEALTYQWKATGSPEDASVGFSVNGTNPAKRVVVSLDKPGTYAFSVTIKDSSGLAVESKTAVTVSPTLASIDLSPSPTKAKAGQTLQLAGVAKDQFGAPLAVQPALAWSVAPGGIGGTISASGLYTAPGSAAGSDTIEAASGETTAKTAVTVELPFGVFCTDSDIGDASPAGSTSYDPATGLYTLKGGGTDIEDVSDQFHYLHVPTSGGRTLVARVTSEQNTDAWAKAGVMFRQSVAADAAFATVVVTPANVVSFQYRTETGAVAANAQVGGVSLPRWVKLVKDGDQFTAYHSEDGSTWVKIGEPQTIALGSSFTAGLALTSHVQGASCAATMTDVSLR